MTTRKNGLKIGADGKVSGIVNGQVVVKRSRVTDLETVSIHTGDYKHSVTVYIHPDGTIQVSAHQVYNVTVFGEGVAEYNVERKIDTCPEIAPGVWYDVISVEKRSKYED